MSTVDSSYLEQLLYRGESETLDFKRDQYAFAGATERDKSKMLKDILSFANSWRQEPAFIMIGVDEIPGGRAKVVGVSHHLDDADLQQFVNSKTQRPIEFSYQSAVLEGKDVGVIRLPVQTRPVYALRRYGIVEKEAVYLRRGSSNTAATPDEVARMGASHRATPEQLELTWFDLGTGKSQASPRIVNTAYLNPMLPADTFETPRRTGPAWSLTSTGNPNYSSQLVEFIFWSALLVDVGLCLKNHGNVVARRVRLVAAIERNDDTVVQDDPPSPPSRSYIGSIGSFQNALLARDHPDPCVREFEDRWEVTVEFGDVRPHDQVRATTPLFLGSTTDQDVALIGELRGDNLATPVPCELEVHFRVDAREMQESDLRYLPDP